MTKTRSYPKAVDELFEVFVKAADGHTGTVVMTATLLFLAGTIESLADNEAQRREGLLMAMRQLSYALGWEMENVMERTLQ